MRKNILVFPCGSEIGLEIKRAVGKDIHFNLIGANGVSDHGKFVYENYIGNVPFDNTPDFIPAIKKIVIENKIDAIYPAVDTAIARLKPFEKELGCIVVSPSLDACLTCLSKEKTYNTLRDRIPLPEIFDTTSESLNFPLFAKPKIGHSGRDTKLLKNYLELDDYRANVSDFILCEYLPGEEYTIDCFTDKKGVLRFISPRIRGRVSNGISVNTYAVELDNIQNFGKIISDKMGMRGAWFFQMKRDRQNNLKLMEVAARFGGSSVLWRAQGVNLPLLSLYDAFNIDIEIMQNNYSVILDRALENLYYINIQYDSVYLDYDDCLIIENQINSQMLAFLAQCRNFNKKIFILSRHNGNLTTELTKFGLKQFFDGIYHIKDNTPKSKFINRKHPIFIDDSFSERKEVKNSLHIPVFSTDMVECLINGKGR